MNTSNIFRKAHALTKKTIKNGDNYAATFAVCLKTVYEMAVNALDTLEFRALRMVTKVAKNGADVLVIKIGSEADGFLKDGLVFAALLNKSKIASGYIVKGRGKVFIDLKDVYNDYQYVYVTKI